MKQLEQLVEAIRQEAKRPEYQASTLHPFEQTKSPETVAKHIKEYYPLQSDSIDINFNHVNDFLKIGDDEVFIEAVYRKLLRRSADLTGKKYYIEKIQQGYGKIFVISALSSATEARSSNVTLNGFGIASIIYNIWRYGRFLGLSKPARIINKYYEIWRIFLLNNSREVTQTAWKLNQAMDHHSRQYAELKIEMTTELESCRNRLFTVQKDFQQECSTSITNQDMVIQEFRKKTIQNIERLQDRISIIQLKVADKAELSTTRHQSRPESKTKPAQHIIDRLNDYYLAFENAHRGSLEDITSKQLVYLSRIIKLPNDVKILPMIDIGCGRGEWLRILKEHGLSALGLDLNESMVNFCRDQNLSAHASSAQEWLPQLNDKSLGLISGFHIIEHMRFQDLFEMIAQSYRVLAPNGLLILETPNPENLLVGSHTFYHDHTHRNPITPTSLTFLLNYHGFIDLELIRLNPYPTKDRLPNENALSERINGHFYGPQDYGIVARKL